MNLRKDHYRLAFFFAVLREPLRARLVVGTGEGVCRAAAQVVGVAVKAGVNLPPRAPVPFFFQNPFLVSFSR